MDAVPGKFYGVWSGLLYAWIVAGAVGSVMILEADLHGECFRQLDMTAGTVFHTFSGCLTDALAGFLRCDADRSLTETFFDRNGADLRIPMMDVGAERTVAAQKYGRYAELCRIESVHEKFTAELSVEFDIIIAAVHGMA